jgi:uncharacterized membrane protein
LAVPALVHFPIAFLLGGVLLGLYAWWRARAALDRVATGLLIAGVALGLVTGLAGLLAMFTMPDTHTEQAHDLMLWHLGLQLAAVVLFALVAWLGWRAWQTGPTVGVRLLGWVAAVVLVVGSGVGGYLVYHGGAGIEPAGPRRLTERAQKPFPKPGPPREPRGPARRLPRTTGSCSASWPPGPTAGTARPSPG